jgi:hypothetical protein
MKIIINLFLTVIVVALSTATVKAGDVSLEAVREELHVAISKLTRDESFVRVAGIVTNHGNLGVSNITVHFRCLNRAKEIVRDDSTPVSVGATLGPGQTAHWDDLILDTDGQIDEIQTWIEELYPYNVPDYY